MTDLEILLRDMSRKINKAEREERTMQQELSEVSLALDGSKYMELLKQYYFLKGRKDAFEEVDTIITTEYM
jgi:hypothetical protein